MFRKLLLSISICILVFFASANFAHAGFGITPPYVKSDKLVPGSHYEQRITLLRSSAEEQLDAVVTIFAPEIESWITIDKGLRFELSQDSLRVPMVVNVDVPSDAQLGNYTGYLNIKIVPHNKGGSGVAIALGARVDIDLTLTDETIPEFKVWSAEMPDIEELSAPWNWKIFSWFFYRVKVVLEIENIGNVETSPSKVHIDIYDASRNMILQKSDDTKIRGISAFKTDKVTASFPTELPNGQYQAKVKVYKENQVMNNYEIAFTIYKAGQNPKGGVSLGIWPWILMSVYVIFVLIVILILLKLKVWNLIYRLLYILTWPLRWSWRLIRNITRNTKKKFWFWVHNKSKKYQEAESPTSRKRAEEGKDRKINIKDDIN